VQLGEDTGDKKEKPKRASLFKSMNVRTLTLEQALKLLSLPRQLGKDAEGNPVVARAGRFGADHEKKVAGKEKPETRSLKDEEQLLSVTLEVAEALFAIPKRGRGRGAAAPPLKELGVDPQSGSPIVVKDGKYGPYVTDGTTNGSLPKGVSVEDFDLAQALSLLADRRANAPAKKKKGGRSARSATKAAKESSEKTAKSPAKKKTSRRKAPAAASPDSDEE
jgi:DNA topoisomerase-1